MHKSWVNWLCSGDKNTKYFHTSALIRRRNKIESLMDDHEVWVVDQQRLKKIAHYFYSMLTSDPLALGGFFQRTLRIIGPDVISLVKALPPNLAEVLLVVVPKLDNPSLLT